MTDLFVPEPWALTPEGVSHGVYHALDFQVGLDRDGNVVVRAADVELTIPPNGEPLPALVARYLREASVELDGQGDTLDQLLLDIAAVPTLGDLLRASEEDEPPGLGLVDGASFAFSIPAGTPAVWGSDAEVLWAEGEPFMIAGPQGVGKTTDGLQLALGLAGVPGFEELYGLPVRPLAAGRRVLYLALDRPRQIARALRRMAPGEHRALIEERLLVWQGAPPFNLVKNPDALLAFCAEHDVGAVVVDSLKDLAGKLSDEEVGKALNDAFQACVNAGVEVLVLHHNRKANAENRRPKTLADVHGSENLTRGLGSVVCLFGAAGDEEVELTHLKQPAETVGPLVVRRDHEAGRSWVDREGALATGSKAERVVAVRNHFVNAGGPGTTLTRDDLVGAGLGSKNTVKEALDALVARGWLDYTEGHGRTPSTWTMVAPFAVAGQATNSASL